MDMTFEIDEDEIPRANIKLSLDDVELLLAVVRRAIKAGVLDEDEEGWAFEFKEPLTKWCKETGNRLGLGGGCDDDDEEVDTEDEEE